MERRVCQECGLEWHGATLPDWNCPRCGGALVREDEPSEEDQAAVGDGEGVTGPTKGVV